MSIEYYSLAEKTIKEPEEGEFRIATAALLRCGLCGTVIDSMGGPGDGAICKPCGILLKRGELIGAVIYEDDKKE